MSTATQPTLLKPSASRFEKDPLNETLEAHDKQEPFLSSNERYHGFVSGLGAGKTNALVQRILLNAKYWNPGETGMVVSPTVPSLRNVLIPELRKWNVLNLCDYKASEKTLEFPNGSRVILESADNQRKIERLRGPSLAWAGMDEASSIAHEAYKVLIGRLRAGDYRNFFVTTTPKGFNWVYDKFGPDATDDPQINTVLGVPSTANPHLPDDYEDILGEYEGSYYEQEALGQFVKFEGLVYSWFTTDDHAIEPPDPSSETWDETIYGVDWGHNNPAVALALIRQGDRWVVAEEFYERRCITGEHSNALEDMMNRWGPGAAYCDPSEPANIEEFRRDGLNARSAKNDVTPGIQQVSATQDELRVARNCQNLINEFNQYQYKDNDKDVPEKVNDHAMDALRYALFTHSKGSGQDFSRSKHSLGGIS